MLAESQKQYDENKEKTKKDKELADLLIKKLNDCERKEELKKIRELIEYDINDIIETVISYCEDKKSED